MEQTNTEIIRHIDESVKNIGKWEKLDHLKLSDEESEKFGEEFLRTASETSVAVYAPSELAHNMPSLIEATRRYVDCFQAGVENFSSESVGNLKRLLDFDSDREKTLIDKELVQRGINPVTYPNEEERGLMIKLGREAFLTGRAVTQIGETRVNSAELGYGTFKVLDEDSKERVAKNVKSLMDTANADQKNMGDQLGFFLRQNKQA